MSRNGIKIKGERLKRVKEITMEEEVEEQNAEEQDVVEEGTEKKNKEEWKNTKEKPKNGEHEAQVKASFWETGHQACMTSLKKLGTKEIGQLPTLFFIFHSS